MKKIILIFFVLTVIVFSSCSDPNALRFYNWGEYIDEDILKNFTKETGIKISYTTYSSNEELYAKIRAGSSAYDVMIPTDFMIERMIREGMLEKIDFDNIPNYKYIDDNFKELAYDPTGEYSVPYMWGTNGILYNTTMVDGEVDSWDILWDPKYKDQIFMYSSMRDSFTPALIKLGFSLNTRNIDELAQAKNLLIKQKPLVRAYVGDTVRDSMINGEAAIAIIFSGDAIYCMNENPDLAYSIPKEGSNVWNDALVIPKGARNKEKAEAFINFLCRPDISLRNTEYIGFSTVNAETLKMLPQELLDNPAYWPNDDVYERCEYFLDLGDFVKEFDRAWTEVLAAN